MTDDDVDDYDEYEYEYEYSDNDDDEGDDEELYQIDDDGDEVMLCSSSPKGCTEDVTMATVENANPNAPPSPPLSSTRIRKSPSSPSPVGPYDSPQRARHHSIVAGSSSSKMTTRTTPPQDLIPLMARRVADVTEALGIPPEAAPPLLRRYKWNTQRVLEEFMSDSDRALRQAGVTRRCSPLPQPATAEMECLICMETMNSTNSMSMPCGHTFCLDCWQDFLTNAIQMEGATCMQATCPDAGCGEILTEIEIRKATTPTTAATIATTSNNLLAKYEQYQLRNFAEAVGRWCPGPGCDRVCVTPRGGAGEEVADCDQCGTSFCTGCSEEPHAPVSCTNLQKWKEKSADESETVNWLTVNTKNCPKCATRIEKNGGCMYVTCRKCHHGFCWICMGTHHVWQCNAYKDPAEDDKLRAKNELERYLHYYTRYQNHDNSQKYARKQLDKKHRKEKEAEDKDEKKKASAAKDGNNNNNNNNKSGEEWKKKDTTKEGNNNKAADKKTTTTFTEDASIGVGVDLPDYLKDANLQLVTCRRVLKYTYVFAYYHFVDPKRKVAKECFEFHQGTLEGLTEGLSKATEKPLSEIDQQDVVNRTRAIGEFIKNVLAHVDDGMDDDEY